MLEKLTRGCDVSLTLRQARKAFYTQRLGGQEALHCGDSEETAMKAVLLWEMGTALLLKLSQLVRLYLSQVTGE